MKNRNLKKNSYPECFDPEANIVYPLCVGNKSKNCEQCYLYTDYEPEDMYGIGEE